MVAVLGCGFDAQRAPPTPTALVDPLAHDAQLFQLEFTPEQGLGPLYNARSCVACHNTPSAGGAGRDAASVVTRVAQLSDGQLDLLVGRGGPIARGHSVAELGRSCALEPGIPALANLTSVRSAPALYGLGLIDAIPEGVILAGATPREDGVHGRPNWVTSPGGQLRVGRFGWKADTPTLELFVADALRNELGITNPIAPYDWLPPARSGRPRCAGEAEAVEDDGSIVGGLATYVASLPAPRPHSPDARGDAVFRRVGCATCHTPRLEVDGRELLLYSDLLLHDLGPDLDDGLPQGQAEGRDWRTTPLWGLGSRVRFLHDGRARSLDAAILAHGGEAAPARDRFQGMPAAEREALLAFLGSL